MESEHNNLLYDSNGYSLECVNCGAPSSGFRRCQWCGSVIPYLKRSPEKVIVKQQIVQQQGNQTIDTLAKGLSNVVYTISGIKI